MALIIGPTEQYVYDHYSQGISFFDNGTDFTYTRLGTISSEAKNVSPGNSKLPIHSQIKGCLMNDDGTINYYLDSTNWAYKSDGITESVLTGGDGQVMIEIPKFYLRYVNDGITTKYYISLVQLKGSFVHPAFIKDGVEVNYRYIGAYEGILYDTSAATYLDGTAAGRGTPDFTASTGDKLSSVSGKIPYSLATRANFRQAAKNRGSLWRQLDYDLVNAIEILYLIEYATFYSQNISETGPGITNVSNWPTIDYYPFATSGNGNSIGDASGDNAGGNDYSTEATKYSKYRGIENFYGHIWKFVDGININSNYVYVTNNSVVWADNTANNYIDTGITLSNSDGYQKSLVNSSRLMLPAAVGESYNKYITDYYYQNSGWRIAFFGGTAALGALCGFWSWTLASGLSLSASRVGARLAC